MDVKSAFLYGKIEEEVYVCQPPKFEDLDFPDRVYKVEKALYGLHQAPRACSSMSSMGELTFFLGLQVQQKKDGIFISQDKYVGEILKKFKFTEIKTASTPMETQKPLLKDEDVEEVDVHMYSPMIDSLMYLTSSRPDIMFACKKHTVVANSTTEAEYVAASSCCGQLLWIQNQLLDYGVFGLELKLMLLGINILLLLEVNAARRNLLLLLEVNVARHNLLLLLKVNAARHKLTTAGEH
ncbi:putative ribonuclease H-like domain-containing protein [Tanacetum coccineum]